MEKQCKTCEKVKLIEEYSTNGYTPKGKRKYKPDCKQCCVEKSAARWLRLVTEHFGEVKCSKCGYDRCFRAIDLHHVNPEEKDHSIGTNRNLTESRLKAEMEKCILLCANCHREYHAGFIDLPE